jgi:dTDP-glucose pyrophosphorylase
MILIPMAGESRRFKVAGYERPKYMLDLHGRPLFDWTVESFRHAMKDELFVFVMRDVAGTVDFVRSRIEALGIARAQCVVLDHPTAGQAETVAHGLDAVPEHPGEPFVIFNIDTLRPGLDGASWRAPECDGWLEVFSGDGEAWSFVLPVAGTDRVERTTEKVRISDLCCTGLYGFASTALFREALAAERASPSSRELFVAPIYNHLIAAGRTIKLREIEPADVIFSGIPSEYEALVKDPAALSRFGALQS